MRSWYANRMFSCIREISSVVLYALRLFTKRLAMTAVRKSPIAIATMTSTNVNPLAPGCDFMD